MFHRAGRETSPSVASTFLRKSDAPRTGWKKGAECVPADDKQESTRQDDLSKRRTSVERSRLSKLGAVLGGRRTSEDQGRRPRAMTAGVGGEGGAKPVTQLLPLTPEEEKKVLMRKEKAQVVRAVATMRRQADPAQHTTVQFPKLPALEASAVRNPLRGSRGSPTQELGAAADGLPLLIAQTSAPTHSHEDHDIKKATLSSCESIPDEASPDVTSRMTLAAMPAVEQARLAAEILTSATEEDKAVGADDEAEDPASPRDLKPSVPLAEAKTPPADSFSPESSKRAASTSRRNVAFEAVSSESSTSASPTKEKPPERKIKKSAVFEEVPDDALDDKAMRLSKSPVSQACPGFQAMVSRAELKRALRFQREKTKTTELIWSRKVSSETSDSESDKKGEAEEDLIPKPGDPL